MAEIQVLTDRCISSGNCVNTAPELFEMDDDGMVRVLADSVDDVGLESAQRAAQICPVQAILVEG
jgi:ferredoxin